MYSHMEMEAMRRTCGDEGRETPGNPRAMCRFGNHRTVYGRHHDTGLGQTKDGRLYLRGKEHSLKIRRQRAIRELNKAPVVSRIIIPLVEQQSRSAPLHRDGYFVKLERTVYTITPH